VSRAQSARTAHCAKHHAEAADHAKASFEQGVAVLEQLASAKTLDKGIEIQTAYAKNVGEFYAGFAKDALKPIAG
jgi:hypothetical protein